MSKNPQKEASTTVVLNTSAFRIVLKSLLICVLIGAIVGAAFMVIANHKLLEEDQVVAYTAASVSKPALNGVEVPVETDDTIDLTGIEFEDKTVEYNGKTQKLTLAKEDEDALKEAGVIIQYFNHSHQDIGTYAATAVLTKGTNVEVLTATLTITPTTIKGITFESAEFVYDGKDKEITVAGNIPSGVHAKYYNNSASKLGTHVATVVLYGENYETLVLTANITIVESEVLKDLVTFEGAEFSYDEQSHRIDIKAELPDGVEVKYENNDQTDCGEYEVVATVSGYGYVTYVAKATIKIVPGDLIKVRGLKMDSVNYVYGDGKDHIVEFDGELPEGVVATYSKYDATNAGVYTVTVKFHDEKGRYEDCQLTATITVAQKDISHLVSFKDVEYTYDPEALRYTDVTLLGELPEGVDGFDYYYNGYCISINGKQVIPFTNAGEYEITVVVSGNDNYVPIVKTAKIIIEKYDVKKYVEIDRNQTFTSGGTKYYLPEFDIKSDMPDEVKKSDVKFYWVNEEGEEVLLRKGFSSPGEYDIIVRIDTANYTYENDVTIRIKYNLLIVLIFMIVATPIGILIGVVVTIAGTKKDQVSQRHFAQPSAAIQKVRGNLIAESRARSKDKATLGRLYLTATTLEFYGDDFRCADNNFLISAYDIRNVDVAGSGKIHVYANSQRHEFTVPKGTEGAWAGMIVDVANNCTNV